MKKIFLACILTVFTNFTIFAEETEPKQTNNKISVSTDFLNSSNFIAWNAEYSPNKYIDMGIGGTPFYFRIVPEPEVHTYARVCFFDFFIQPYVQLDFSFISSGWVPQYSAERKLLGTNTNFFNAKVGAGVKLSIGKYFFCGLGGNYNFVGQNLMLDHLLYWKGFTLAGFIGSTILRF